MEADQYRSQATRPVVRSGLLGDTPSMLPIAEFFGFAAEDNSPEARRHRDERSSSNQSTSRINHQRYFVVDTCCGNEQRVKRRPYY